MRASWLRRPSLPVLVLLATAVPAMARRPETPRIRFKQLCRVKPNGDVDLRTELIFSVRMYSQLKGKVVNTALLLRELGMTGTPLEMKGTKVAFDDGRHAVVVTARALGGAKNRGKTWFIEIQRAEAHEVADTDPNAITLLCVDQMDTGVVLIGTMRTEFPEGTRDIRFDADRGGLTFAMPPPPSEPAGEADLDVAIQARKEIMSCLYKVYGNPKFAQFWVARAVFRNRGTATLRELRVRFRIPQYSSWSPWKRSQLVYPTQTVVEPYYPILSHDVRKLHSATPVVLEVEWTHQKPDGAVASDSDTRRLSLLGLNQAIASTLKAHEATSFHEWHNLLPLVCASFVTHTDPIIQRYAGMAARLAGGAGASLSVQNAQRYMKAVYDLMCYHQIKYQSPPWMFKDGVRQHVKYGRDVLQNRAGTCIDLAILYASACKAGGLDVCLVSLPGHCFPAVKLPGGNLQPVEVTLVSGDPAGRKIPYQRACQIGEKELRDCFQSGDFYLTDVAKFRALGVPPPELPDLPPSTLDDWGIKPPPEGAIKDAPAAGEMKTVQTADGLTSFPVPKHWRVQPQGQAIMAGDPAAMVTAMAMGVPKRAQSLDQFAREMVASWKLQVPGWTEARRWNCTVGGHKGIAIRATGKPGGMDLTAVYYLTLSERHQYVLSLTCRTRDYARWKPTFDKVFAGWRIK